jgi:hypothetical protein
MGSWLIPKHPRDVCRPETGIGEKRMEEKKMENEQEKNRRIGEVLADIQNDIGYHFDYTPGRHDWFIVEYQHDRVEVGLPASVFNVLISSMEKIGLRFIKIFVCKWNERTLDIVFREIVPMHGE